MTSPASFVSTILALTDDLFLVPRLEDAARALGWRLEVGGSEGDEERPARPVRLTEPLEGAEADLVRRLATDPPALILVDLASTAIPWRSWIPTLKTSSTTRRIPILAFGPHVEADALEQARALGADRVVTRGELQKHLGELLRGEARPPDHAAIRDGCALPIPEPARRGLEALAAGDYFQAHEHLERAVLDEPGPEGTVFRTLLHLAVACLHTERGNWRGAQKMLLRMRPWLAQLPEECRGLEVASLRQALAWLQGLLDRWNESGEAPPLPLPPPKIKTSPRPGRAQGFSPGAPAAG